MGSQVSGLFGKALDWVAENTFNSGTKIAEDWAEARAASAAINGAANPANARMYATGKYIDYGIGHVTHRLNTAAKAVGLGAFAGLAGTATVGLLGAGLVGVGAVHLLGAVTKRAVPGAPKSALNLAGVTLGAAAKTLGGAELVARTLLTGTPTFKVNTKFGGYSKFGWKTESALDAWLPNFRNMGGDKLAKYALNPRIATRITAGAIGVGIASAAMQAITPKAPPASAYYDGVRMRRIGDMGATADYGQRVMNSAPNFSNLDYRTASQSLVHLL